MLTRSTLVAAMVFSLALPVAGAQRRTLRDRGPVTCTGIGKKVVKNARIRGVKYAVAAMGSCKIVVRDSEIIGRDVGVLNTGTGVIELINTTVKSPGVAVANTGTGVVRLDRSIAEGGKAAVELTGTGLIKARRTIFRGKKIHTGLGRFEIDGKTRWEKGGPVARAPAAEPAAPRELRPHRAIRCAKNQRVDLANVIIRAPLAVVASGSCRVRLRDSEIAGALVVSGGTTIALINTDVSSPRGLALSASGGTEVSIEGGTISGRRAYDVSGGARVSARGVTFRGRGTTSRSAKFKDLGGNRFLGR